MKRTITTIAIIVIILAIALFIDYKIATSDLPDWLKYVLLND